MVHRGKKGALSPSLQDERRSEAAVSIGGYVMDLAPARFEIHTHQRYDNSASEYTDSSNDQPLMPRMSSGAFEGARMSWTDEVKDSSLASTIYEATARSVIFLELWNSKDRLFSMFGAYYDVLASIAPFLIKEDGTYTFQSLHYLHELVQKLSNMSSGNKRPCCSTSFSTNKINVNYLESLQDSLWESSDMCYRLSDATRFLHSVKSFRQVWDAIASFPLADVLSSRNAHPLDANTNHNRETDFDTREFILDLLISFFALLGDVYRDLRTIRSFSALAPRVFPYNIAESLEQKLFHDQSFFFSFLHKFNLNVNNLELLAVFDTLCAIPELLSWSTDYAVATATVRSLEQLQSLPSISLKASLPERQPQHHDDDNPKTAIERYEHNYHRHLENERVGTHSGAFAEELSIARIIKSELVIYGAKKVLEVTSSMLRLANMTTWLSSKVKKYTTMVAAVCEFLNALLNMYISWKKASKIMKLENLQKTLTDYSNAVANPEIVQYATIAHNQNHNTHKAHSLNTNSFIPLGGGTGVHRQRPEKSRDCCRSTVRSMAAPLNR